MMKMSALIRPRVWGDVVFELIDFALRLKSFDGNKRLQQQQKLKQQHCFAGAYRVFQVHHKSVNLRWVKAFGGRTWAPS